MWQASGNEPSTGANLKEVGVTVTIFMVSGLAAVFKQVLKSAVRSRERRVSVPRTSMSRLLPPPRRPRIGAMAKTPWKTEADAMIATVVEVKETMLIDWLAGKKEMDC